MAEDRATDYRFEIAISFAGDNKRETVRAIAEVLRDELGKGRVFFDEWFEAELAGPDAQIVLQNIYRRSTRLVVTCVCKRYGEKSWTQEEWRAIQAFERDLRDAASDNIKRLRFFPLRFGDGDIDGLFDTAIVPDVRGRSPRQIADLILERLRLTKPNGALTASKVHAKKVDHAVIATENAPVAAASVIVNVDHWREDLSLNNKDCAGRLIRGQALITDDNLYIALEDLIEKAINAGLLVEATIPNQGISVRIKGPRHFWALLLSRSVIDGTNEGPLKWLIEVTKQQLMAGPIAPETLLIEVWRYVCQSTQPQSPTRIVERTIAAAIESIARNRDAFYPFVLLLYSLVEKDPIATRVIGRALQGLVEKLGNSASFGFLTSLKRLVGRGLTFAGEESFVPRLVPIAGATLVPYKFEASVYPLTVFEYWALRGIAPMKLAEMALYPFVFEIVSRTGQALLNKLASEMESVLRILEDRFEDDGGHRWDIPTVCEWLSLAGCDRSDYPWGEEAPTQAHANIHFEGRQSVIRPVGTFPQGASPFHIQDCCGNVHEIVRVSFANRFPQDFRLAGGCFQTAAHRASCRIIRPFRPKEDDLRRNVGLRLVRYPNSLSQARRQVLEDYVTKLRDDAKMARNHRQDRRKIEQASS